ncbi:MAG: MBL fold metallo-hydrolase [Deltaproteobacteria bacterium]|nr:MBL fold metallo-hydrolase [Deltaproteobacteria bacterium]
MKRVSISDRLVYVLPPRSARASFLGCSGLVVRDARTAIIDGNMGPDETPAFLEAEKPDVCVVSHFHVDHSRWAHEAAQVPGVVLHVPRAELRYLADMDHFVERCGLPDEDMARSWRTWLTQGAGLRPVPDAVPLAPGDVLDLGATRIDVVDAKGHSPGHQAYWIAKDRILFCVDIGVDGFGPWYGWRDADLLEYVRSIWRLVELDARLLVTSHGGLIEKDVRTVLLGCLDVMRGRETVIAHDLDEGLDVETITARGHIYGDTSRFPPPLDAAYRLWEENMVREHVRIISTGGIDAVDH